MNCSLMVLTPPLPPPINEIFNDEISLLFMTPSLPHVIMKFCADVSH